MSSILEDKKVNKALKLQIFLGVLVLIIAVYSTYKAIERYGFPNSKYQAAEEAQIIYQVVLEAVYSDRQPYVIDRQTRSYQEDLHYSIEQNLLPGLKTETAQNFEEISDTNQDLGVIFREGDSNYVLIDPAEYYVENAGEVPEQCGWTLTKCFDFDKFRSSFPNAQGYIQLSNIGFNPRRSQALAAVEMKDGSGSGTIYLVLLSKEHGDWVIQDIYERFWTA